MTSAFDPRTCGWQQLERLGAFADLVGPFWAKREGESWAYGLFAEARHSNAHGIIHGGMIATFLDQILGLICWEAGGARRSLPSSSTPISSPPPKPGIFSKGGGRRSG